MIFGAPAPIPGPKPQWAVGYSYPYYAGYYYPSYSKY